MRIINIYLYKRRASQLLRGGDLPTSGPKIFQMRARSLGGARESSSHAAAASRRTRQLFFVARVAAVENILTIVDSLIC